MPLGGRQSEALILQMLLPNLEAEGFRVFLHPSYSMLPPFMKGFQPDAIAVKEDKKIAIEIKPRLGDTEPKIQRMQEMFSSHPDWELRVIYAPEQNEQQSISVIPHDVVVENLNRLPKIYDDAGPIPALLTGWSVFEAAARSLIPDDFGRPQPSGRLLEKLASDGYLTPEEADSLRTLAQSRNDAAHGRLDIAVSRDQLTNLVSITRTLLQLSKPHV